MSDYEYTMVPKDALNLAAESAVDLGDNAEFVMVASSGVPFAHPVFGNFAVDFEGLSIGREDKPVLLDHDPKQRIGFTNSIKVGDSGSLEVSGKFLKSTAAGQQALAEAEEGYPWQSSVKLHVHELELIPGGKTATVNGHELSGPGHVARSSTLREVTFTALGADEQTSAVKLSEVAEDNVTVRLWCAEEETDTVADLSMEGSMVDDAKTTPAEVEATEAVTEEVVQLNAEAEAPEANTAVVFLKAAMFLEKQRELLLGLITDGADLASGIAKISESNAALLSEAAAETPADDNDPKSDRLAELQAAQSITTHTNEEVVELSEEDKHKAHCKKLWAELSDSQRDDEWDFDTFVQNMKVEG